MFENISIFGPNGICARVGFVLVKLDNSFMRHSPISRLFTNVKSEESQYVGRAARRVGRDSNYNSA